MSTQRPDDPRHPSLSPSQAAGGGKPDFSNVQAHSDTVPASGPTGSNSPDFSNVQGHADTRPDTGAAARTYTVKPGDTLSHIAQSVYGKASRWHAIFEANRDQLQDPDLIRPGQVLQLPSVD
ncbi:MAG: LysM peptidoglycan-binding domain-containing protein [Lysobacteraceae bacterium]